MNSELLSVLDYLENERGIDRETLIELVEESLVSSAYKVVGPMEDLKVQIDRETGDIQAIARLKVVEKVEHPEAELAYNEAVAKLPDVELGDVVEWEVTPANFGRIAAQKTKQTIMLRLKQAEKDRVCEDYEDRVGEMLSGVVVRVERGDVFVDLTGAEAVIPYRERIPGEEYQPGDHICCVLIRVNADQPGPTLVASRARAELVASLFRREVTEINEGLVEIKAVAREPGYRSKIAVTSEDPSIDPVGACVGMRGNRVKTVVRELGGEKVDIIHWSPDIKEFVRNALQPANLASVELDEDEHMVLITAPEDQLSLAIGKKGQNARLAAKLTGWRIDISKLEKPEDVQFEDKIQRAVNTLIEQIPSLDSQAAGELVSHGFLSLEGLSEADPSDLTDIEAIDVDKAEDIIAAARDCVKK
ncbi:MAG: transcription termination factor NusA [Lentisphaeria bacterium]